jgi:hypothetical protein
MDDDFRVTSELYRLMPPRKRTGPDPSKALDAAPSRQRHWARRLGQALARVDVWILIAGMAGVVIALAKRWLIRGFAASG